jgi:hypothetical protein
MPAALLWGFIFDNLTLTRIDQLYTNAVLFTYLIVAGIGIIVLQLHANKVFTKRFLNKITPWLPLVIQFTFGGLFSGYFVFYSRSASLAASWFFMLVLLGLLVGNEFFRKHYTRFTFQISIYYLAIFSFTIFFIPVIIGKIGAWVFVLSGAISLVAIWIFLYFFFRVIPEEVVRSARFLVVSILGIYISINLLYFQNIIPPIPLSLKDIGVYHSVEKTDTGDYLVVSEDKSWFNVIEWFDEKIHIKQDEPLYIYSAVFAPTDIRTDIVYVWQYYNDKTREWVTSSKIPVSIVGGRGEGYRSFSMKENLFPGKWRVGVTTPRGQLIGRVSFTLIVSDYDYSLQSKIR